MQADPVKYELWGLGIGLALALTCAILIVIANGSSRNLALGLGALVGAVVVFGVQALFELQGSTATDDIYIEVVVDYQTKSVRSVQPTLYSHNIFVEDEVSKLLADKSPPLGRDDAPRIVRDLAVVSVLSYLFEEQPDWQLNSSVYKTARGTMSTWQGTSKANECSYFSPDEVKTKLEKAENIFASALRTGRPVKLCLPPNSTMEVTTNSVTIRNRYCQISISFLEPFISMSSVDPQSSTFGGANLAER